MRSEVAYTESEIISLFSEGDASAFEIIYNKYFNSVFYFAKRFVIDVQAAEDITSETFVKLWTRHGDFENIHKLTSFLYITTRNACINILRTGKRHSEYQQQLSYLLSQESDEAIAQQQLTGRIYQYIYEEIEKLPPQEMKVFKLAFIDGLSNEEIAEQLNINNQSVRNHKTRALKAIRLAIADKDIYKMLLLFLLCRN